MSDIVLTTLNARYSHASLGLRCLLANLGAMRSQAVLREYTIKRDPQEIVDDILACRPRIVGFGVYIWNVVETTCVLAMLKRLAPEVVVVLGGPEVSHETEGQEVVALADHVITGPGEISFMRLCQRIMDGDHVEDKLIPGLATPLDELALPYGEYSDEDLARRIIYVEASRGCPFKCEFCLSALDKTAKPFPLEHFLDGMQCLYQRGARRFKFIDRTFNLDIKSASQILEFFLDRLDERLFLHFEIIPDRLPDALKSLIARFPPGALQFEVGVQTFNPTVQALISRRQDNDKTESNLRWLKQHSHAHLHADLIIGLPGEDLASFKRGFDRLVGLGADEIQVGMLKRLRGAPIIRHVESHGLNFNPNPPYEILSTDRISVEAMRRLARFARYWDIFANTGRFPRALRLMLGDAPFERFLAFSDWLYSVTGKTHELGLERLWRLLYDFLSEQPYCDEPLVRATLAEDFAESGVLGHPRFLRAEPVNTHGTGSTS